MAIVILNIEDLDSDSLLIRRSLSRAGLDCEFHRAETELEVRNLLKQHNFDIVICDHALPNFSSTSALKLIQKIGPPNIPFILVSGSIGEAAVVEAMKDGVSNVVSKDCLERLAPIVGHELEEYRIRREGIEAECKLVETCAELETTNEKLRQALQTLTESQKALVRNERLKAMGEMSSGIAHDFNNVLTKLLGIVELLEIRVPEEAKALEQMHQLTQDGAVIVRRLRGFYCNQATEGVEAINLTHLVEETVELTRPKWMEEGQARNSPIKLRLELSDVPEATGGSSQIREVLTNLIFNACDAMPQGGDLTLITSCEEGMVTVEINDSGTGMSEETLQKCLEPFFTTKGENGTGLGLALASSVLEGYGGNLKVSSTPGVGTSVLLNLLRHEPVVEVCEIGHRELKNHPCGKLTLLVVDDDPMIVMITSRFLKLEGHDVISAGGAEEALQRASECHFDAVISDLSMPGMNGKELAQEMKLLYPGILFILATGFGDLLLVDGKNPSCVDLCLSKPISRHDLREALEDVFSQSRLAAS